MLVDVWVFLLKVVVCWFVEVWVEIIYGEVVVLDGYMLMLVDGW